MSNIMTKIIENYPDLNGIYNISSPPISKYDLITKINTYFKLNIETERDSLYYSNKSLNSNRFFSETNFKKPNWDEMLSDLHLDSEKNKNLYNQK
jgi:dTDP-4-dehydrorhamnose reductase